MDQVAQITCLEEVKYRVEYIKKKKNPVREREKREKGREKSAERMGGMLVAIREESKAAKAFVGARRAGGDASGSEAGAVRPVVAGGALSPVDRVGLGVVVDLVAMRAVLVFLVAKTARVAEVEDFALDEAVAPKGRVGSVAVGALMVVHPGAARALALLPIRARCTSAMGVRKGGGRGRGERRREGVGRGGGRECVAIACRQGRRRRKGQMVIQSVAGVSRGGRGGGEREGTVRHGLSSLTWRLSDEGLRDMDVYGGVGRARARDGDGGGV